MKAAIIISFILITSIGISQNTPQNHSVIKFFRDRDLGSVLEQVDTVLGDTMRRILSASMRHTLKSKEGVFLIDGHWDGGIGSTCGGCEVQRHGYWIERYRNGELKAQGRYKCGRKIGIWNYYYENGQLSKVENLAMAYLEVCTRRHFDWDTLKRHIIHEGPYLEYYSNGQLKTEGAYDMVEVFSTTDTLLTFDMETYEERLEIINGEFWMPQSKKVGVWNYYSESGRLLKHEILKIDWTDKNIRSLEARYLQVFGDRYQKPEKKE